MTKFKYNLFFGIFILLLGITAGLFMSNSNTEDQKNAASFEEHYRIHSLQLPASLDFAGETFGLDQPDLIERYDRELLTNVYWQSQTLMFIKRASRYFPVIEKILKEQGVPDDFKYLAVAESGLIYTAISPSGAAGYWQFLEGTGKRYGLQINDEIDERYHLEKATVAACAYFKEAYQEFGSWMLVAASYNMGIEGLRKQVKTQGINLYHDLYLNTETSRYIFRMIALKNIMEKPESFGFYIPFEQRYKRDDVYRLKVDSSISDLAMFALNHSSTYKEFKWNNPWLRKNTVPVKNESVYLALPKAHLKRLQHENVDTLSSSELR